VRQCSTGRSRLRSLSAEPDTRFPGESTEYRRERDRKPGPTEGETARLPLAETPRSSCTSILDSLDGAAPHLGQRVNLAVVAKADPDRIANFAGKRGWRNLRLLCST
jgi:hypothetical protein